MGNMATSCSDVDAANHKALCRGLKKQYKAEAFREAAEIVCKHVSGKADERDELLWRIGTDLKAKAKEAEDG
tara:strand:+ start:947 stop:1162 length:216 start_codon:yes stop_codon:yes gene_type:complete